jgi:hypothetical protein
MLRVRHQKYISNLTRTYAVIAEKFYEFNAIRPTCIDLLGLMVGII